MENEEALFCCGRVKSTRFLTCELAWAPLSLRSGESKLYQPLVLWNQKLLHMWAGESEFCAASFIYYFFCQVSHTWGKGKPEVLFHCLLKALSYRQAQDCFSALILNHPSSPFCPLQNHSVSEVIYWSYFLIAIASQEKQVWTWGLDILPLRLYASNQQQMATVQPKCKVN